MTTATTNTVLEHSSDATFRTWVAEVIAQILAVGITQTADTGQINTATVTRPGISTAGGFAMFRFNDTAHATNAIFFKLEFGTGSGAAQPMMWITVGRGSNGSGTLTGLVTTRVAAAAGSTNITSPGAVPYVSRFCYSAAQGVFWMGWKYNALGTTGVSAGGFAIFRSTDAAGAPTTDSTHLLSNSNVSAGGVSSSPFMQVISHLTSVAYTTSPFPTIHWLCYFLVLTVSLYGGNAQVWPAIQYTPVLGVSAQIAGVITGEVAIGSTTVMALIGATTHTFIGSGGFHGGSQIASNTVNVNTFHLLMLWE